MPTFDTAARPQASQRGAHIARVAAAAATKVVSICTGVMLLDRAGIVSGRRVATHHSYAEELASRGTCLVERGRRFLEDGDLISSAGISSGIDASLRLVEVMFGAALMRRVADEMEWPNLGRA